MVRALALSIMLSLALPISALGADMATWEAMTRQRCPAHHLEWTCDGCWDDFLADFEGQLPKSTQRKILQIADYDRRCRNEVAGFSCEMSVHVDALQRLHLLNRLVAWGCANYRCEEQAICSRAHGPIGKH